MSLDVARARADLVARVQALAKPGAWDKLQAYLGSPVPVLGLSTSELRGVLKEFVTAHPALEAREVNRLAAALWAGRVYEEKILAIGLLSRHAPLLDDASWRLADGWVDEATGWALSDGLASGPLASMVVAKPSRFRELLTWTKATSYWRRRASTYALSGFVSAEELDRPFRLLEKLLYDDEFWVQRAVGTWLRECWKRDRRRTERFLRSHVRGLPPVTITVATERAPKAFREELRRKARAARRRSSE